MRPFNGRCWLATAAIGFGVLGRLLLPQIAHGQSPLDRGDGSEPAKESSANGGSDPDVARAPEQANHSSTTPRMPHHVLARPWTTMLTAGARPASDPFEPDDTCSSARPIVVDGPAQQRDFYSEDDEDWLRIDTIAGQSYLIATTNLGPEVDTVLRLYDSDCRTVLRERDDWPEDGWASRIYWQALRDRTMFVRVTTLSDSTDTTETGYDVGVVTTAPFIDVRVEGVDGEGVENAVVEAYTNTADYYSPMSARTDAMGWAPIETGDGPYTIFALSGRQRDAFLLRRDNVSGPTSITMRAEDAAQVTFRAVRMDGSPFAQPADLNTALTRFKISPTYYSFGSESRTDDEGEATMFVTPGTYNVAAWDWGALHDLGRRGIYLSHGMTVTFDARRMPVARVHVHSSGDRIRQVALWNQLMSWGPFFEPLSGETMIVSEESYRMQARLARQGANELEWEQALDLTGVWNWGARVWARGGTSLQLRVAPAARLRTATMESVYHSGDYAMLVNAVTDVYGNGVSDLAYSSPDDYGAPRPHTIVRGPDGQVVYDNNGYGEWAVEYFMLPQDARPGRYAIETTVSTGLFGGVLGDRAEFNVLDNRWVWPPSHWRSIFLPLVRRNDGYIETCNGGFEGGLSPCWSHGGPLSRMVVGAADDGTPPLVGQAALRLGDPGYGAGLPDQPGIPIGAAWVEQRVQVPDTKFAGLEFWYRMITFDVARDRQGRWYDVFEASVSDGGRATQAFLDGNFEPNTSRQRHDLGWRFGRIDLTPWRGRSVTVRFLNWNSIDPNAPEADRNNTWTYLDDVNVRYY